MIMKFEFNNETGNYHFVVVGTNYISITVIIPLPSGAGSVSYGSGRHIKNNKILWQDNDYDISEFLKLTEDVRDYANKIIKLKAFW
jgi:hypothetical protein